jgi:hypothetical protein
VVKLLILTVLAAVLLACSSGEDDGFSRGTPSITQGAPTATPVISGPTAMIEPSRGRPGTEVVVTGRGWPAQATITIGPLLTTPGMTVQPLATVTAEANGTFTVRFRVDRTQVGRFDLAARSGPIEVRLPFEVDPPVPGGAPGG